MYRDMRSSFVVFEDIELSDVADGIQKSQIVRHDSNIAVEFFQNSVFRKLQVQL
jgi:hypothetical protein